MAKPKRVWTNKKLVYSAGRWVWDLDGELGVFDPQFKKIDSWETYEDKWDPVPETADLVSYDTSAYSNYIGTFEDGTEATYTFEDYDGTVLKTGKVKDGKTPKAPTAPTREGYQFTWWDPVVWPIKKDTTYTAQYVAVFTLTIAVNDADYGTTDKASIVVPTGTQITNEWAVLTAGSQTVTATPNEGYAFTGWSYSSPVTANATATASFEAVTEPEEQVWE